MAKSWDEIAELCTLCAEGKLYEVEAWIENGRPIQCEPSTDRRHWKLNCNPELTELLLRLGADPNRLTEGIHALESMIGSATGHRLFPANRDQQTRALACIRLVIAAGARWNPEPKRLERIRRNLTAGAPEEVCSIVSILRENHVLTDEQLHELTRTPTMRRVLSGHGRPQKRPLDLYPAPYQPAMVASTPAPARTGYWKRHWSKR